MARFIYSAIMSLDGCIAGAEGNFDWAGPDEEVRAFANDLERPVGTYLCGRRMYETMRYWETRGRGGRPASRIARVRADLAGRVRLDLALADEPRFSNGTVYLCYRPA
jgi:dihydrofolate reductase